MSRRTKILLALAVWIGGAGLAFFLVLSVSIWCFFLFLPASIAGCWAMAEIAVEQVRNHRSLPPKKVKS